MIVDVDDARIKAARACGCRTCLMPPYLCERSKRFAAVLLRAEAQVHEDWVGRLEVDRADAITSGREAIRECEVAVRELER